MRRHASLLLLSITLLSLQLCEAEKDSNPYPWGDNPNNQFKMYWNDARNVLQDLDEFQSLYIKYHGCVWSECAVDSYDDDSENRDGDEHWYQYRTQPFCANAAYSLYGVLKRQLSLPWKHCSRGTYINSFFTYGGSDTIMEVLNMHADTLFEDYDYDNDDGGGGGYGSAVHPNAVCYEIEDEDGDRQRHLGSGDNDDGNQGMSSTMGCSRNGEFVAATFQGQYCDGNYFLHAVDDLNAYNSKMSGVNCRQIWNRRQQKSSSNRRLRHADTQHDRSLEDGGNDDNGDDDSYKVTYDSAAEYLLSNSWACDVSLYPDGCPDPYGLKSKYDAVMAAVSSGNPTSMVIFHARMRTIFRIFSTLILLIGLGFLVMAYYVHRKEIIQHGGLRSILWQDTKRFFSKDVPNAIRTFCRKCRGCLRRRRSGRENPVGEKKKRRSKKEKKSSRRSSGSGRSKRNRRSYEEDTAEDDVSPRASSSRQTPVDDYYSEIQ